MEEGFDADIIVDDETVELKEEDVMARCLDRGQGVTRGEVFRKLVRLLQ